MCQSNDEDERGRLHVKRRTRLPNKMAVDVMVVKRADYQEPRSEILEGVPGFPDHLSMEHVAKSFPGQDLSTTLRGFWVWPDHAVFSS